MDSLKIKSLIGAWFSGQIICLESVSSTNDIAKEYAIKGEECLITAEMQTAGRGRYDRSFESRKGGLYMSTCLKVNQETLNIIAEEADEKSRAVFQLGERLLQYPVQAGEAVRNALENLYEGDFEIKLPNDILLMGKKVCGILMEAVHHDDDIFLIFGIGINMENELSEELTSAENLKNLTGKIVEKELLCAEVMKELYKVL